ncbi:reverse transcriptase domain-containing protein [Salinibius halmophilus]|uniref:reverse transcriptase domain-containing protein n=1 Tax=Salinibius halmophilus TaxID=1853216 RepID=UPI000E667738|nr:reverse transcriptase domain-containing protein [Salinibius halmophilus]
MKLIDGKYRLIRPTLNHLCDEVVIAQAWKKTHSYIRSFNWYADTLELDSSAMRVQKNCSKWAEQLDSGFALTPMELVPAAKSEQWGFSNDGVWQPVDERAGGKIPLRPLAHLTIRDQTLATTAMLCLADAVESRQGKCDLDFVEARSKGVYSYGNRLLCDWKGTNNAWFRWGNSETYRKFFVDYQNFLNRPLVLGRQLADTLGSSDEVFVVNLDISQFFNSIDNKTLIKRLEDIVKAVDQEQDPLFWDKLREITDWEWSEDSKALAAISGMNEDSLNLGLPQGLVASGFFANAYLCEFDSHIGKKLFSENAFSESRRIILHDYCRYVDDLRLVVSAENAAVEEIKEELVKFVNKMLLDYGGENLSVNDSKTKVTLLSDLDNEGSMSNRVAAIQSELSGPVDRDSIKSVSSALETLLVTDDPLPAVTGKDSELIRLASFDHDVRPDTLKRFAANRFELMARSKRRLLDCEHVSTIRADAEDELLAKKLIFAWMKDPSLGIVLRKAMEIYPDADIFESVLNSIFERSSLNSKRSDNVTSAMMDYLMADIFRAASDFNGYFQRIEYSGSIKPDELLQLLVSYAQRVVSYYAVSDSSKGFLFRQALMLLAVVNRPFLSDQGSNSFKLHSGLHKILANDNVEFDEDYIALYEIACQITGDYRTSMANLMESIKGFSVERKYEVLSEFAISGGKCWHQIWRLLKLSNQVGLIKKIKWAEPVKPAKLVSSKQRLSRVISSLNESNLLEHSVIELGLELVKCIIKDPELSLSRVPPSAIDVTIDGSSDWAEFWQAKIKTLKVTTTRGRDPRFEIPKWIVHEEDKDVLSEQQKIYWIGTILRALILGNSDFTGMLWSESETITYYGVKSSWYKRRMGMLHSPEALTGNYATVSQWTSELLMFCLQWPGFESTYLRNSKILNIETLDDLKMCLQERKGYMASLVCRTSNLPTIPTAIYRPESNRELFRIATVQQLQPTSALFKKYGPELSQSAARAIHRDHLSTICKLTLNTLVAKSEADGNTSKPYCDLIVFPEVSVHPDDEDIIRRLADKTNAMIFAGFVFENKEGKLVNYARWLIPSYSDQKRQWIIRDQGKQHMTKPEKKMGVQSHRPCQHLLEIHGYGEKPFTMSGAICYDATDIKLSADLRDKTDLFVIAAHNPDVKTFDNMAAALQWHMYQHVVICNIGEYGGSTIQAPYKEHYEKVISHVHGSGQISVNMADIDPYAFTREVSEYKKVKTPPAGFSR